jgi:4-carboxymuconolactone decarboxylase
MRLTNQDVIAALDTDFAQMAVEVGQHAWGLTQLTMREKVFAFLAADLSTRALGFPLHTHVQMALTQGVTMDAMREAIRHLAPYVGYPTAAEALMALSQITAPLPARSESQEPPTDTDLDSPLLEPIRQLDEQFAEFFTNQFAQRWGRAELTVRERALATIATDVLQGTLDESLRLHVDLALRNDASGEQIRAVVLLVAEFGIAKAWAAYRALDELLKAQRH